MNANQIKARLNEIDARQDAILKAADQAGGKLNASQRSEYDRIEAERKMLSSRPMPRKGRSNWNTDIADPVQAPEGVSAPNKTTWTDASTGREIRVYGPRERIAATNPDSEGLSVGRFIQSRITGDWSNAPKEYAATVSAMGTADGSGSTFLLPDPLSDLMLDFVRSATVVQRWGAQTVTMESDSLRICGQASDPTFSVIAENQTIPSTSVTFRALTLNARKFGAIITISRELAQDAPNAASVIESALMTGLSTELDKRMLLGDSGDGILGLVTRAASSDPAVQIPSTGSVGSITWTPVHNAVVAVKSNNFTPNGYVCSPSTGGSLDILQATDSGVWLGPPPSVAPLVRLETTSIGNESIVVGDGSRLLIGIRDQVSVQISTEAGDAFAKDQIILRVLCRLDFVPTHQNAFHVLTGIS